MLNNYIFRTRGNNLQYACNWTKFLCRTLWKVRNEDAKLVKDENLSSTLCNFIYKCVHFRIKVNMIWTFTIGY